MSNDLKACNERQSQRIGKLEAEKIEQQRISALRAADLQLGSALRIIDEMKRRLAMARRYEARIDRLIEVLEKRTR